MTDDTDEPGLASAMRLRKRLFAVYLVAFVVALLTTALARQYAKPALVALGAAATLYGLLLVTNIGRFTEANVRAVGNSRWTAPAFASVPLQRCMGAFAVLVGVLFMVQAINAPL